MAQHTPEEQTTIEQVLKLVDQLSVAGKEKVLQLLKYQELRREIQLGIDQADRGELFSEEQVMAEMELHHEKLRKASKK
jgi:hypothetical protein